MHPKVAEWLRVRDRAYQRGDAGIVRSMNYELRRLNIPDDATFAHPSGPPKGRTRESAPAIRLGRPKMPRCEHENIADRCELCNPEIAAH